MKLDKTLTLVFAGFGGQGVLTAGRIISDMALMDGINATWLPAYGFAVRGARPTAWSSSAPARSVPPAWRPSICWWP